MMNDVELRNFVRKIIEVMRSGASFTDTTIDDQTCDMILRAIDSDVVWGWVAELIGRFLKDEPILVEAGAEVSSAMEVEAINPLTIIAIIQAIVSLWKQLRPKS
jgi:hypothetical protein